MTRYKLKKDYPNHKIGDIAIQHPENNSFIWEASSDIETLISWVKINGKFHGYIPSDFHPDRCADWWQKMEEEKSLEDYEKLIEVKGSLERQVIKMYPRIYWTEVLRCIAKDLNKQASSDQMALRSFICTNEVGQPIVNWTVANRAGMIAGVVYFKYRSHAQKAIDLLGENIKFLFND